MLSEREFITALREMTAEWYMFGCAMEMSTTDLDIIEDKGGLERYMKDMLAEWLKTGSATWEKLQEALRSVGNKRLASELEKHRLKDQQKRLTIKHVLTINVNLYSSLVYILISLAKLGVRLVAPT